MKNIKFKVLIMFMLLVLVGFGSCSVFATSEQEYLKIDDLYELVSNRSGKWLNFYRFDENNKVEEWPGSHTTEDGQKFDGFKIADTDGFNDFGELWQVFVVNEIIEKDGVKWIRKDAWVEYLNTSMFSIGDGAFRVSMVRYADSVTHKRSDLEIITQPSEPEKNPQDYEEGINNFWQNAFDWFKGAQASGGMGTVTDGFMKGATNIIKMVGNMIFIVVTSILGVKYIWGSADAKYSVKNSLFSLVIAAVVFYGWDSISNIIQTVTTSTVGNNIESTTKTIYTYILYFVNIAAIGGIIFLGVKYLLASAEGKSQLKMNMGPAFLGIIMVYATISFLNTILNIFLG